MSYFNYNSVNKRKIKCSVCGKEFFTTHPKKKTCSIECSSIQEQRTFKQANKDNMRYYSKARKSK